jgi:hypothetical protein
MNSGATAYVAQTISGDSTMTTAGVMTNQKINGVAFSGLATGLVKNTTGTGVPSIAGVGDVTGLFSGGPGLLRQDGTASEISGDGTTSGSNALTLATVNSSPGATNIANVTTNGKGLVTANTASTAHQIGVPYQCSGSGSGTAQTCSTSPTFVATAGDCISFTPSTNNTADVTLAVNGGSALHFYKWAGSSTLAAGDLQASITQVDCLDANNHWEIPTVGNPPASGATINNQTQFGVPYYSVSGSSNTLSGVAPPATQGYFNTDWINPTNAATAQQVVQVGLGTRAITGSATTCGASGVLLSDVDAWIDHDQAATGTVNCALPAPITLNNTTFAFRYTNHSPQTDTITPGGSWTIQKGTGSAGASINVASGEGCVITVDPFNATNWMADCGSNSGLVAGGTLSSGTQGLSYVNNNGSSGNQTGGIPVAASAFSGADVCAQAVAASAANTNAQIMLDFTGNKVCSAANAHALFTSATGGKFIGNSGLFLYVPLAESAAGNTATAGAALPPTGVMVKPTLVSLEGGGSGALATANTFNISVCTVDFVGKEPIRIEGSSVLGNNGSWTVCQRDQTGTGAVSGRADPSCPADPTSTVVYVAVPSGIIAATTSAAGTITIGKGSGGTPKIAATATATSGTTIFIQNPGQGYSPTPTCTNSGGTCTVTLETACASSCGNIHGEIPVIDDGCNLAGSRSTTTSTSWGPPTPLASPERLRRAFSLWTLSAQLV